MIRISSPPSMRALAVSQVRGSGHWPALIPSDQPDQGHEAEHDAGCNQGDGPPVHAAGLLAMILPTVTWLSFAPRPAMSAEILRGDSPIGRELVDAARQPNAAPG
jgi:hypothetical protein